MLIILFKNYIIFYRIQHFKYIKLTKNDIPNFFESIDYNIIFKNDYITNITLNYIIDEIIRLINYNSNKNIKTNIINFIAEIICTIFNQTFFEVYKFNQELNYFYQILYTSEFYLETQNSEFMIDNLDDDQKEQLENNIENDNEEFEGIDMGDEIPDSEGIFDHYSIHNENELKIPSIIV